MTFCSGGTHSVKKKKVEVEFEHKFEQKMWRKKNCLNLHQAKSRGGGGGRVWVLVLEVLKSDDTDTTVTRQIALLAEVARLINKNVFQLCVKVNG